ncbi:apolipoprotein Eb [Nematolebias whitei]|uniref:apolipoprotein Eb n=1 Tax=Nematolebias whitei TaxID=451745 RepID=UPI00189A175E|nr:apolipoprotein Eb [Nematolebias whitei]
MKAAALILALAVITGCNARPAQQADASLIRLEESVDRFWQYIAELNQKAELRVPQLNQELDTLITNAMAELTAYKDDIQTKLAPHAVASTNQMSEDLQLLASKLQTDMTDAKVRSSEYLNELKSMVDQNLDDVRSRITTYTTKLRKRLAKDTEEIRETAATYLGEVQSRATHNLGTVKENVEPYVHQASDDASQKLRDISVRLETQAENFKTQLESTLQELSTSMDGKLEELTKVLSPYATQFREQFETILDKVKETATA